jgi:hypothetical protein
MWAVFKRVFFFLIQNLNMHSASKEWSLITKQKTLIPSLKKITSKQITMELISIFIQMRIFWQLFFVSFLKKKKRQIDISNIV